jgi:rhodanese-related sulfurtransferase
MKNTLRKLLASLVVISVLFLAPISMVFAKSVPLITKEELKPIISNDNIVVIDVRGGRDWSSSEFKIVGAAHGDPKKVSAWKDNISKNKKVVLYCA